MMSKLLVIDKNRFQGIAEPLLVKFVRNYNVVLPYALGIECLISNDGKGRRPGKSPMRLLSRFDAAVKAGAYFGYSSSALIRKEKETLCAVDSVVHEEGTRAVRDGFLALYEKSVGVEAACCRQTFQPLVDILCDLASAYLANINKKGLCRDFQMEIQKTSQVQRFCKWLDAVRQMKTEILRRWIPDVASNVTDEWYTWQVIRLWWAWATECAGRRSHIGGPITIQKDVSNDLYDMEYIAYLSKADGILTRDKTLVEPLARAAFPDKDVFSSLDEVPDDYLCDWG